MVDVRAEIKKAMKAQGRTAYWLAKASGIRMGTVYAYVGKRQDMNGEYIGKLLSALGLRIIAGEGIRRESETAGRRRKQPGADVKNR